MLVAMSCFDMPKILALTPRPVPYLHPVRRPSIIKKAFYRPFREILGARLSERPTPTGRRYSPGPQLQRRSLQNAGY